MVLLPAVILSTSCSAVGSAEPVSTAQTQTQPQIQTTTQQVITQTEVQTEPTTNPQISQEEVLSFLKEQYDMDCNFSELPADDFSISILTNDFINPSWMWNVIWQKEDFQSDISNYAAYYEVQGLPEDAFVLWHLENRQTFAISESFSGDSGDVEYWNYTSKHKYLFTGRCKNSACYCYAMADSREWTKPYVNVDGIFVVYKDLVYPVVT